MLCYMVELTLRYRDFLGGPNLIIQVLKSRELSIAGSRRGNQRASKHKGDSPYFCWVEDGGGCTRRNSGDLKELREDPG